MAQSDAELKEALETCAAEPVHIPGSVQPYACLLTADGASGDIKRVSANSEALLGKKPTALFDKPLHDIVGRELWHAINNAKGFQSISTTSAYLGEFDINGRLAAHIFESQGELVLELEEAQDSRISKDSTLDDLTFFMASLESPKTEQTLFDATVTLLKDFTGYDRVMIYRFDHDYNGEVLAEERERAMESYDGLRFPHWDIPPQARDMMRKVPMRFISDVDQKPVPFTGLAFNETPLDISLAGCRGVSPVHMDYLRNMGSAATLTLSVLIEDKLWGIISLHHRTPRVPDPDLRQFLGHFTKLFCSKLQVLHQAARLEMVEHVDQMKDKALDDLDTAEGIEALLRLVMDVFDASGVHIKHGPRALSAGTVPQAPMLDAIQARAKAEDAPVCFDNLAAEFPTLMNASNRCAGALALTAAPSQTLTIFRPEITQEIAWAGNPEKTVEDHEGRKRLAPRGSFSVYIDAAKGAAKPWSEQDLYFANRLKSLINSAERREMMSALTRQQNVLIDELNHRVRNILALVRSVSQQARRSYGTLESYSRALEARIQALAASHDLVAGAIIASVPIRAVVEKEFAPYANETSARAVINGTNLMLNAEVAPIFALVIHELVTNAVKHGALLNDEGIVTVDLEQSADGLHLTWTEAGGPPVTPPEEFGFGSTLIRQAVPHELDGTAELDFAASGVVARIFVPQANFDPEASTAMNVVGLPLAPGHTPEPEALFSPDMFCLIVEDNFVLAQGLRTQLKGLGLQDVKILKSVTDAKQVIGSDPPDFAILDINLGKGETSQPVAEQLSFLSVPFVFLTGYGDSLSLKGQFPDVPRVTKPATTDDLLKALGQVLEA